MWWWCHLVKAKTWWVCFKSTSESKHSRQSAACHHTDTLDYAKTLSIQDVIILLG